MVSVCVGVPPSSYKDIGAKFNESLLVDKHHQNLLQVNSLMRDLEQSFKETSELVADNYENDTRRDEELVSSDNITDSLRSRTVREDQKNQITKDSTKPPAEFLPSPQNDPYDPHIGLSPIFLGSHVPPSVIAQSPSPDPIALVTLKKSELRSGAPYPRYQLNPRHSMYPGLLMPPSLLSVNGPGRYIATFTYSPSPTRPTSKRIQIIFKEPSLKVYFQPKSSQKLKAFSPAIFQSISNPALSSKTRPRFTTPLDEKAKIWLKEIAPYTPVHKRLKKVSKHHTASFQRHRTPTMPTPPRMALAKNYRSTGPANPAKLLSVDEHGFLQVNLPKTISEDPNKNTMMTSAGDVLYGKIEIQEPSTASPMQPYIDLMEQRDEGYPMFFAIEMCRLIAMKSKDEVRNALHHMETIYNQKWNNGQLDWIEEPLQTAISRLLEVPPRNDDIQAIQIHSKMMYGMLQERKKVLSPEVNSIIDDADMFFNDEDGGRLLNALKEFEDFPNTPKTSYWICYALIDNFMLPFRHAKDSQRRQKLLDSINKALKERFPLLTIMRESHKGTLTAGGRQPRKRKRKRHKKKKKRTQLKQIYMRHTAKYRQKELIMTPIPPDRPRFTAITRKRYRPMNRSPTPALPFDHELYDQRVLRKRLRSKY